MQFNSGLRKADSPPPHKKGARFCAGKMRVFTCLVFMLTFGSCLGDLECELRQRDAKSVMIGQAAIDGLKFDDGRNATNLQIFACHCETDETVSRTENILYTLRNLSYVLLLRFNFRNPSKI